MVIAGLALVATSCSSTVISGEGTADELAPNTAAPSSAEIDAEIDAGTGPDTSDDEGRPGGSADPSDGVTTSTSDPTTGSTTEAPVDPTTTSTTSSTTTTTTEPPLDVYEPECVLQVRPGESLSLLADRFDDDTVTAASIRAENGLGDDVIFPGQFLDVCVGNGVDDITGEAITERNSALVQRDVEAQQIKLNELFAGLGIRELLVDGVSGPVTRQRLCAARLALGLDVNTNDMEPGSEEEQLLMATETLPVPFTSSILSERWILIDVTCQIMFVGAGTDELVFVFPTSTGEEGHRTRMQDLTPMYRYNPAADNDGWHNSTTFPAADDNPLNGNMYKPLYFDRGQAIHGANNVPTSPQSKGCARLRVEHQDLLIDWLGLADSGPTTNRAQLNVTVNVQGEYVEA
jgi:LysM repeat protein